MFGSQTKVERIQKWSEAKQVNKIIRALSDREPTVRAAAASALAEVDNAEQYTGKFTLDLTVASLLTRLNDNDPRVVASVVRALRHHGVYSRAVGSSFGSFARPETLKPLIVTMERAQDVATREAAREAILHIILSECERDRLAVFSMLSEGLARQTVEALLEVLATVYVARGGPDDKKEETPFGHAFVSCGPQAGRQLVKVGERKGDSRAVAFGQRIIEGKECGLNHVPDEKCICAKCGKTIHDFAEGKWRCVCQRCGQTIHEFRNTGSAVHYCRCGAAFSTYSGDVHEPDDLVRQLAEQYPDKQIAAILARQGRLTGAGNQFTAHNVHGLRTYHKIPAAPVRPTSHDGDLHADAETDFMFFVNCSTCSALLLPALAIGRWGTAPLAVAVPSILAALASYGFYRGAVIAAVSWGIEVRASLDLHRFELYQRLGVRLPASFSDERFIAWHVTRMIEFGEPLPDRLWGPLTWR